MIRWLRARPALLATLGLAFIAIWEVVVLARAKASAPTDEAWRRAEEVVRAGHRRGDLIVVDPPWADPVLRLWLGDLMRVEEVARMDERRYARIWRVQARRGVSVVLEERPAPTVVWDLGARAKLVEVDFAPRMCAEVPVGRPGAPARLELGPVTLGSTISSYAGLYDFRSRRENRSFAEGRLLVDGAARARAVVGSETGWVHLGDAATAPGEHTVAFEAEALADRGAGNPGTLSLCVAAESYQ